nr:hypothetical protein [Tanacetum cinerariifolium]
MVSTRGMDDTMKEAIVEIVRCVTKAMLTRIDSMHSDISKLTDRIEALMMFQNFAMGEFNKIISGEGTKASGSKNGEQNSRDHDRYTILTKFGFPRFNADDVDGWLLRVQQFFVLDNVRDENKLMLVSMHLYDKALSWDQNFVKINEDNVHWAVYAKEIKNRFDLYRVDGDDFYENCDELWFIVINNPFWKIFGALTDEAIRNGSIKKVEKRGNVWEPRKDKNGRDDNKRTRIGNAFATTANPVGRENAGAWPCRGSQWECRGSQ